MQSFKKSKFITPRPGSSARVYDIENSGYDTERKSRIPRLPKRTYSLEGKGSHFNSPQRNKKESSTTSMIPRLEWKKSFNKNPKPSTAPNKGRKSKTLEPMQNESSWVMSLEKALLCDESSGVEFSSEITDSCLECRINENFANFKSNILKIPEYWKSADHTVSNIFKNAINIVAKEYPTADVEAFEKEIQNILTATDAVKHEILAKTEDIINQANKIYVDRSEKEGEPSQEELERLAQKMEELKNEVDPRKNASVIYGSDTKHVADSEKEKDFKERPRSGRREASSELEKNEKERFQKRMEMKKSKMVMESSVRGKRRKENITQSCGDVPRHDLQNAKDTAVQGVDHEKAPPSREEKFTQTINLWTAELHRRDKDITVLNEQILELQQLCKDHISKFKSFNLQIKLRGLCNKAVAKETHVVNDENNQPAERNKLHHYTKDLETALKKKNLALYQKDKVINQQKRLLHVRDELIEMLKSRCNLKIDKI